jgi:hypothetical protein
LTRERRELGPGEIRRLLAEVGRRLAERGVHIDLFVVGGAAMALRYDRKRVTVDVDALPRGPAHVLFEVSREVASEYNLPPRWLNANAGGWVPPLDPQWVEAGEPMGGLNVVPAGPEVLLAMKMLADREWDFSDLVTLVQHLGLRDAESVVAIVREVYPDGPPAREPDDAELLVSAQEVVDAAWPC